MKPSNFLLYSVLLLSINACFVPLDKITEVNEFIEVSEKDIVDPDTYPAFFRKYYFSDVGIVVTPNKEAIGNYLPKQMVFWIGEKNHNNWIFPLGTAQELDTSFSLGVITDNAINISCGNTQICDAPIDLIPNTDDVEEKIAVQPYKCIIPSARNPDVCEEGEKLTSTSSAPGTGIINISTNIVYKASYSYFIDANKTNNTPIFDKGSKNSYYFLIQRTINKKLVTYKSYNIHINNVQ